MIKLDSFTVEDALVPYEEYFKDVPLTEAYDVKQLPFEDKVRFVKYVMGDARLVNQNLLINIALLVKGNDLADEIFQRPEIFFTTLEEYVDVKFELKDVIKEYAHTLMMYFFSALRSYSLILPDGKERIPEAYAIILCSSTLKDISKLLNKIRVNSEEWILVEGADSIINALFGVTPAIEMLMDELRQHLNKEE